MGKVLEPMYGPDWVGHWMKVLVLYPFYTPIGEVRYAVGSPMGGYSIWAAFALTHHYVFFWCCKELGIDW